MTALTINTAGLILDICGAWLLAQGLVLNSDRHLAEVSATYWDSNLKLLRELVANAYDARFGVGLLIAGFVCQFDGSIGRKEVFVSWFVLFAGIVFLIAWLALRAGHIERRAKRIAAAQEDQAKAAG